MSAPSHTDNRNQHDVLARDACFTDALELADEIPTAELAPPVRPATTPSGGGVTRGRLLHETLKLELLLSLWRLEFGSLDGFREAHPDCAAPETSPAGVSFDRTPSSPLTTPAPITDENYVAQVALQLFGNQAA